MDPLVAADEEDVADARDADRLRLALKVRRCSSWETSAGAEVARGEGVGWAGDGGADDSSDSSRMMILAAEALRGRVLLRIEAPSPPGESIDPEPPTELPSPLPVLHSIGRALFVPLLKLPKLALLPALLLVRFDWDRKRARSVSSFALVVVEVGAVGTGECRRDDR